MKKVNVDSLIGTVVALVVATFIGFAGSQGGVTYQGFPLFALCAALAILVQWLVFIPSMLQKTEHYFDLTGSVTYVSVILFALMAAGNFDPPFARQFVLNFSFTSPSCSKRKGCRSRR